MSEPSEPADGWWTRIDGSLPGGPAEDPEPRPERGPEPRHAEPTPTPSSVSKPWWERDPQEVAQPAAEPAPASTRPSDPPSPPSSTPSASQRQVVPAGTLPGAAGPSAPPPGPTPGAQPPGPQPPGPSPTSLAPEPTRAPVNQPSAPRAAPAGDGAVVTTIWGGTSSGKSTFLWTLPLAVDEAGWTITPTDGPSGQFLSDARATLISEGVLPEATLDRREIHWELRSPGRQGRLRREPSALIDLRMTDRDGRAFQRPSEELVDELEASDAVVFLFDAQREFVHHDAFTFFGATMDALRTRMRGQLLPDGQLPQYLAVCVAKLDEVSMVHDARRGLWLTQDPEPPYLPGVADEHAEDFFDWICRDPRTRTARSIRQLIRNNFAPERTSYWVTSAVGFNVPSGGQVDLADPDNLRMVSGRYRLRTPPRPINVLEPLVALHRAVAGSGS